MSTVKFGAEWKKFLIVCSSIDRGGNSAPLLVPIFNGAQLRQFINTIFSFEKRSNSSTQSPVNQGSTSLCKKPFGKNSWKDSTVHGMVLNDLCNKKRYQCNDFQKFIFLIKHRYNSI